MNDNELILKVATQVMGWKLVATSKGFYAEPDTLVYHDGDRIFKSNPYSIKQHAPEGTPYAHTWQEWNPLSDNLYSYMDVVFHMTAAGSDVIIRTGHPEGYRCSIVAHDNEDVWAGVNNAGLGRAICLCALKYMDECQEIINTLNR